VKHLLILISILLLSSPVIGNSHKGETLYEWGKYPDYKWMGFGEKDTNPKYQGQVKNGVPNGLGYLIYPDGGKYVGSWEDGKMTGQGTFIWSNGDKYVGSWKEGQHWNVIRYNINGTILFRIVNGEYPPLKQTPPKNTSKSKITTIS